jgi:hypothetical protein
MAVYFAQVWPPANEHATVKIGSSADPLDRLAQLSVGQPGPMYFIRLLYGGTPEEGRIHKALGHLQVHGEVFRFHSEMLTADFGLTDYVLPRFPAFSPAPWLERVPAMRDWRRLVKQMIDSGPLLDHGVSGALRGAYRGDITRHAEAVDRYRRRGWRG